MTKELDTSWFDLKNYEALKTMSIEGWASVLQSREDCKRLYDLVYAFDDKEEDFEKRLQTMADKLKAGYFSVNVDVDARINEDYAKKILRNDSFSTSSVDSLMNWEAWEMAVDRWPSCEGSAFQQMRDDWLKPWEEVANKDGLLEAGRAPYDFRFKQYLNSNYMPPRAHVVIDLRATEEQIKNDFNYWLKHYRQAIGIYSQKKSFTQSDFDYWIQYGAIPYLDLNLIAKIEGKKITQNKLARLIFPDDFDVDIVGRLRQVTKPIAEMLIKYETWVSLFIQITHEKME